MHPQLHELAGDLQLVLDVESDHDDAQCAVDEGPVDEDIDVVEFDVPGHGGYLLNRRQYRPGGPVCLSGE